MGERKLMLSNIAECVDYPILKERLSADELAYAAYLCEKHENATADEHGAYICGCHNPDKDGYDYNFCVTGLWLESCTDTDDFIKEIKSLYAIDGIFAIKNRIEEEELEEFLLTGGWDVYDDIHDIENRILDSTKVSDIAHDYGFIVEDTDADQFVYVKHVA